LWIDNEGYDYEDLENHEFNDEKRYLYNDFTYAQCKKLCPHTEQISTTPAVINLLNA